MSAAHVLNQRIAKTLCFRPLTDVLTRKSNAPPGGPHFGSNSPMYGAQRESNARGLPGGGMGGFGIDWYIAYYVCPTKGDVFLALTPTKNEDNAPHNRGKEIIFPNLQYYFKTCD